MARLFDDASSEYLEIASTPTTTYPFTLAGWFYPDDFAGGVDGTIIQIQDASTPENLHCIQMDVSMTDLLGRSLTPGNSAVARSPGALLVQDTWQHGCAVYSAANSRAVFVNGGNKATNATSCTPSGLDSLSIGRQGDSTPGKNFSGSLAEVAVWNVALTDAEVASLGKGYSPLFIRPQSIVFYTPLIRDDDEDLIGGLSLTAFNTPSIADHPRIIYPTFQQMTKLGIAPVGLLNNYIDAGWTV